MSAAVAPSWDRLVGDSGLPRLEARVLLESASARRREWLIGHGDEAAEPHAAQAFLLLVQRRCAGEPIAYLTGAREFRGRRFEVTRDVLIPRPETEMLVQLALERARVGAQVLDLGTGSGAIAVTLAAERADLRIVATDCSAAALEVARRNAVQQSAGALESGRLELREGNWWEPILSDERFDLVVSNPPYVADKDPHAIRGDLRFEPRAALLGGADGLDALRRIIARAARHLHADGWLLLEHGHDQGARLRSMLTDAGWGAVTTVEDDAGIGRVTLARPFL